MTNYHTSLFPANNFVCNGKLETRIRHNVFRRSKTKSLRIRNITGYVRNLAPRANIELRQRWIVRWSYMEL